jgi:hypothetical protein
MIAIVTTSWRDAVGESGQAETRAFLVSCLLKMCCGIGPLVDGGEIRNSAELDSSLRGH